MKSYHPRLFLDLDGVFANFDDHFLATFGVTNRGMDGNKVWKMIAQVPTFFRDLPVFPGSVEFFRDVSWMHINILTSCSRSYYQHVARQKKEWIREHLSPNVTILPVESRRHKPLFMHAPGDILIDDFPANVSDWEAEGGVAILHKDFQTTEAAFVNILQTWSPRP